MAWAGDCPADGVEMWARLLVYEDEYKLETLVEGAATCPAVRTVRSLI
jgi:hypothetical protein